MAGGADVILIPEIPYSLDRIVERIKDRDRWGAKFSIVVAAEGARPRDGKRTIVQAAEGTKMERLGGVAAQLAADLERHSGKEARYVVLGHLQRGGAPTPFDRMLATRFGATAVELVLNGVFGVMVANRPPSIVPVPLSEVVGKTRTVPLDSDLIKTARSIGVAFGD